MSLNDDVDGWVAQLMQCKPLSEGEVKKLCEKVSYFIIYNGGLVVGVFELVMMFDHWTKG